MAALSLRKRKFVYSHFSLYCLIIRKLNKEKSGRFWVRKLFQERKRYGLHHVLKNGFYDKE